jgi:hypothetical protein
MKKSEAKSEQSAGELEAPVSLTPEQLEIVAAGFAKQITLGGKDLITATTGLYPMPPIFKPLFTLSQ